MSVRLKPEWIRALWKRGIRGRKIRVPKYYPISRRHPIPFEVWREMREAGIEGLVWVPVHIRVSLDDAERMKTDTAGAGTSRDG